MASPRVFISSTCYDFSEIRDSLKSFIEEHGFESCLSDYGDVFYHPDLHTHESCVNEIANCHLFILMIGGRFGGTYVSDTSKSIVNAEYFAAKELGIPVFSFVKREVLDDHRFYLTNSNQDFSSFKFPSIEEQSNSINIFEFIDEVRLSSVNNGFFSFENSREIQCSLRKQWSGMFFDFLQRRKYSEELKVQDNLLSNLTSTTEQLDEIVKTMYRKFDKENADAVIENVEIKSAAEKLFRDIESFYSVPIFSKSTIHELVSLPLKEKWYEYFESMTGFYTIERLYREDASGETAILCHQLSRIYAAFDGELSISELKKHKEYQKGYDAFKKLSKNEQGEILAEVI